MGEIFRPDVLQYFRRYWEMGQLPSLEYLKKNGLYQKHIFTDDAVHGGMGFSPIAGATVIASLVSHYSRLASQHR
jgi:hypothetical protein